MNIAHLLPYSARFPLAKHHGRHEWAFRLAQAQAKAGHQVTIYAGPSQGGQNISWVSLEADLGDKDRNNRQLLQQAISDPNHQLLHSHFDYLHYELADETDKPIVVTQHWFPNEQIASEARKNKRQNVVAVPGSQQMLESDDKLGIRHSAIIRQGIDLELFKPVAIPAGHRFLFVGRIAPHKGTLEAVEIARRAGVDLDIVGKINQQDKAYWTKIEPLVDGEHIKYLGPKNQTEVASLMANAIALIFPSQAPEAGVQVPIEVQACGTPVIMSDVGAAKEWLEDGKTGYVVDSEADWLAAVAKVQSLDRRACRQFAEQFGFEKMVRAYDELYKDLLAGKS